MRVDRDLPPEHEGDAAARAALLEDAPRGGHALGVVVRQEEHGDAVVPLVGEELPLLLRLLAEEAVRHLEEHARPVTGVALEALASPVLQVHEHRQRVVERLVAADAVQVRDRTDAARIVLVLGTVEAGAAARIAHGAPLVRGFKGSLRRPVRRAGIRDELATRSPSARCAPAIRAT